jgi:uncharacterized protein
VLKETLYPGELPPAVSLTAVSPPVPPSHLVPSPGNEVDLVLEIWDGRVVGFEVKTGSRVQDTDLSGLRLLRDRLGERFMAGFLLNLGELAYRKEERIIIMPLSGLWPLSFKPEPGTKCVVIACTADCGCTRRYIS